MLPKTRKVLQEYLKHHEEYVSGTLNKLEALSETLKTTRSAKEKEFNRVYKICQKQMSKMHKRYADAIRSIL